MVRSGRQLEWAAHCVGVCACVQLGCVLLVQQPVPSPPARNLFPGARVLLIVHTSSRQDPGRPGANYLQRSPF